MTSLHTCGACLAALDTPTNHQSEISRRTFLSQSAILAAAAALAACAGGADTTAPSIPSGTTINVSNVSFDNNGVALVTLSGAQLAVVRMSATSFVVLSRVCPHQGGTVQPVGSSGFQCPNHGAEFSLSGQWQGGQRTTNLHSYTTSFDATTGVLTIS
jgi:cytochrome b6-f complex iron-sulfur subunit